MINYVASDGVTVLKSWPDAVSAETLQNNTIARIWGSNSVLAQFPLNPGESIKDPDSGAVLINQVGSTDIATYG